MKSSKVRIWKIKQNQPRGRQAVDSPATRGRRRSALSYTVRWTVAGREKSETFSTEALADRYRAKLLHAVEDGQSFDTITGLPDSMRDPADTLTIYAFARQYMEMKWPRAAAKSRDAITDALATLLPTLTTTRTGKPAVHILRGALRRYGLPLNRRDQTPPPAQAAALRWLEKHSLPMGEMTNLRNTRAGLDALTVRLDGTAAAAETVRRKRTVFYNLLQYAIECEHLPANPIDRVNWKRPVVAGAVDRRVVINPTQATHLLTALTYVGRWNRQRGPRLRALFGCMYYAALRPAEAVALRSANCTLPAHCTTCHTDLTGTYTPHTGCGPDTITYDWGTLTLDTTHPQAGKQWTDTGKRHEVRGLKHRADHDTRDVPIHPPSSRCCATTSPPTDSPTTAACSAPRPAASSAAPTTTGPGKPPAPSP